MDTAALIWIIVGVIIVAIIVVVTLIVTSRGRAEKKRRAEHEKAEKLRAEAREKELAARESEARAAQTRADAASAAAAAEQAKAQAAQADVEARRLSDTVGEQDEEAAKRRAEHQETLRKADDLDPFVASGGKGDRDGDGVQDDRDRHDDRADARAGDARTTDGTTPRGEAYDGVPAAPDGVVGRDATASAHTDAGEPPITRPRAATGEVRTETDSDAAPAPTTRRDNV